MGNDTLKFQPGQEVMVETWMGPWDRGYLESPSDFSMWLIRWPDDCVSNLRYPEERIMALEDYARWALTH